MARAEALCTTPRHSAPGAGRPVVKGLAESRGELPGPTNHDTTPPPPQARGALRAAARGHPSRPPRGATLGP
ncbi:unnamed protein product [Lampetra fluviatilis]